MVVGVTYEITSSALIWPALEDSIRWVRLGEHQVTICRRSSSSRIYDIHRVVSAAVALRAVWMLNVMLVTAQASKCCLRSCTCCCNTASVACTAVHVAVILQVVGTISVPCLAMLAVVLDIITHHLHIRWHKYSAFVLGVSSCTDFLLTCILIWQITVWMEWSTLEQCYFLCLGHWIICMDLLY